MKSETMIKSGDKRLSANMIRIHEFLESGSCCCSKDCMRRIFEFQLEELHQFGKILDECSHEVKEAALLMNLREHLCNPGSVCKGDRRKRQRISYCVFPFGLMCRKAYLLIWNIGVTTLRNCTTHMINNRFTFRPRIHGRSGTVSPAALGTGIHEQVVQYILDIAENIGEVSGGRYGRRNMSGSENKIVYYLPAPYSITGLYRQFLIKYRSEDSRRGNATPLSLSSFRTIFYSDPCSHVRIRSPRSDVCDECALYRAYYRRQPERSSLETSKTDEEKVIKWQAHLQSAKSARMVYNNDVKQAKKKLQQLKKGALGLDSYIAHYTFDFMQNLALPNFADMTKDMYFFSLRNIHVFSIRDDGDEKQFNYLYDEGDGGKGANHVLSMLFYFLRHRPHQFAAMTVHLHADNCCGQNKNNAVMQFFLLMVQIGYLKHAELKFMIRGHTHCTIDGGHGIIKKEWRKRDIFCMEQAAQAIKESSPVAGTQRAFILRSEAFYDWEKLLSEHFKKLPGILSFQEFEMDAARPGTLRYRRHHKGIWQEAQLFKKGNPDFFSVQDVQDTLIQLKPPGISEKKQKHLYEKVRKYVPEQFQDSICPVPAN